MSEKKFQINYGRGVTVFPRASVEKLLSGEAALDEIKVLSAILSTDGLFDADAIAETVGISPQSAESAIAFWRGAGVLSLSEGSERTRAAAKKPDRAKASSEDIGASTETADSTADITDAGVSGSGAERARSKKALLSAEMPKYTGEQISALLSKDGGALKSTVDECQQLIGHIFNPTETETLVGLYDWLGVDGDFIITLTAYYTRKKPGCNVRYVQRAATDLVNSGIDTIEALDSYLKELSLYDGLAGKLRGWLGIGERAYTKKENAAIKHWITDLGYGEDIVKYAYDITVENTLSFNFSYANKILEGWYKEGVRSVSDAEALTEAFKAKKADGSAKGQSSFDTDEFFELAVKRSYEKMASGKSKA